MDYQRTGNSEQVDGGNAGQPPAEPVARSRTGELPAMPDGRKIYGFATLSHSNLKSYAKIQAAQGHNTRDLNTPNARPDADEPIELLEEKTGSYVDRVKAILRDHGEPGLPVRPRKGGTIACEDIYGASPEYWNRNGDWKLKPVDEIRSDPVVQAALALARRKHGPRLVSCSLHVDEESPHIHVISVPLVRRAHSKRGRKPKGTPRDEKGKPLEDSRPKVEKWTLDVSSIRGLSSQLEKNHDEWADVCKPFHLIRGSKGSEMTKEQLRARRHRQTGRSSHAEKKAREERQRLHAEAQAAADRAKAQEEENERVRSELVAEAQKLAEEKQRLDQRKFSLDAKATSLEAEAAVHDAQLRLISKVLDPTSGFELRYSDEHERVEAVTPLDDQDRAASRGSWDWLAGGLEAFVKRVTALANREAAAEDRMSAARRADLAANQKLAEVSERLESLEADRTSLEAERVQQRCQMEIARKALDPDAGLRLEIEGAEVRAAGLTDEEEAGLQSAPGWFKAGLQRITTGLRSIADRAASLDRQEDSIKQKEASLAAKIDAADRKIQTLDKDQDELDRTWEALWRTLDRATNFLAKYKEIPERDRAPTIAEAYKAAEELSAEDLPPGYTLPGKGGQTL